MLFNSWIIFFSFHFHIFLVISAKERGWLKDLNTYLKPEAHQVLVLSNQNKTRGKIDEPNILQKMLRDVPICMITFQEAKAKELSALPIFRYPQSTTIVLLLCSSDSELEGQINFITQISEFRRRPKCLMILTNINRSSNYKKFLRQMWSKGFLDATIVEIKKEETKKSLMYFTSEVIKIHSFNLFTGIYSREDYTLRRKWFPQKTQNLQNHEMKVGLFSGPPAADYTRNYTGHVDVFGSDIMLAKALSEAMKFRIQWVFSNELSWGSSSCIKENNTGFFRSTLYNEIQFVANKILRTEMCGLLDYTINIKQIRVCIVVPNLSATSVMVQKWEIYNIFIFLSLLIFTWIISLIFHFERVNWKLEYLIQMIFGFGIPREPRKLAERIVFASILISCMLHSSFIYTAFTSVSLEQKSEVEFNTIEDVALSNLPAIIHPFLFKCLYNHTEGSARLLLDKSIQQSIAYVDCLKFVLNWKNASCVVREEVALWLIAREEKSCGKPKLKIVPEYLIVSLGSIIVETSSPYVSQFNKLILALQRAGLVEKWHQERKLTNNNTMAEEVCNTRNEEAILIQTKELILLAFGYSCAIFLFLCELLVEYITKRIRNSRVIVL